jgi:hypothetical protein
MQLTVTPNGQFIANSAQWCHVARQTPKTIVSKPNSLLEIRLFVGYGLEFT